MLVLCTLCTNVYVNRDAHMKCNVAELSDKLLAKLINENAPKTL